MPNKKPLITFALPCLLCGGAERATLSIIRGLLARDYQVDLLLMMPNIDAEIISWIPNGVEVFTGSKPQHGGGLTLATLPPATAHLGHDYLQLVRRVKYLPRLRQVREDRLVASYITHRQPDIILPGLTNAFISALLAHHLIKQPPPIVPIIHGPIKIKKRYRHRRRLIQNAACVVTVSDGLIEKVRRKAGLPAERITTIYNPVIMPEIATFVTRA